MAQKPRASWVGPPPERSMVKMPPLHPPFASGFGVGSAAPTSRVPAPVLPRLPDITAHYPLG
jgi:hypothetical protein